MQLIHHLTNHRRSISELREQNFLTVAETCHYLNLSRSYITIMRRENALFPAPTMFGRRVMFCRKSLDAFISEVTTENGGAQ